MSVSGQWLGGVHADPASSGCERARGADDSFKAFLDKSRERAEHLPESEKTLRLIRAGTPLIARAAQADTSVAPHLELKALMEVGDNVWVKVQPQTVSHTAGAQPKKTLAPAGAPV